MRLRSALAAKPRAVCAVVRGETLPGMDREFEALLQALARDVRENEPGCASYVVTRQMGSTCNFAVHMRFDGWRAFNAHAETDHFERALPGLTALLARPVSLEIFLEV